MQCDSAKIHEIFPQQAKVSPNTVNTGYKVGQDQVFFAGKRALTSAFDNWLLDSF